MAASRLLYLLLPTIALLGCQNRAATVPSPSPESPAEAVIEDSEAATARVMRQEHESDEQTDESTWMQVQQLYEAAKASGSTTAETTRQWVSEQLQQAANSGDKMARQTAESLQSLYEQAHSAGETTAGSVSDWVMDDVAKMGSWQYLVRVIKTKDAETLAKDLNALGSDRWECFHVLPTENGNVYYFKKRRRSYLQHIPARELLRMLPLLPMGGTEE